MKLIEKILRRFNGLRYPQEYLCVSKGSFEQPLSVYLIHDGRVIEDITAKNNFVGYSPLVFALTSDAIFSRNPDEISIAFTAKTLHPNEEFSKKDAVALLRMKKIKEQPLQDHKAVLYYEGIKGRHHFLSSFRQLIIQWQNRFQQKPGNIYLPGNLLKQVQIAYSVPRNISLVTVGENGYYNLFPTDLHGPADDGYYIISLRHEGKASAQVMKKRRILLTQVHHEFYKTVYALGKNHMQDLKAKENFPFGHDHSAVLHLPLPPSAVFFRELELNDSFIHGIHRILLFKVIHHQRIQPGTEALAHIHSVYATWRHSKGLAGNYLMR